MANSIQRDFQLYSEIVDKTPIDRNQLGDPLYDLTNATSGSYVLRSPRAYTVNRMTEMRLDKICYELFGRIDYVHQLMKINQIYNPFSIKKGDTIIWSAFDELEDVTSVPEELSDQRQQLIDEFKKSQVDTTRVSFLKAKAQKSKIYKNEKD